MYSGKKNDINTCIYRTEKTLCSSNILEIETRNKVIFSHLFFRAKKKNLTQSNHQIVTLLFGVGIICLCHIQTLKRVKEYNTELPFEK